MTSKYGPLKRGFVDTNTGLVFVSYMRGTPRWLTKEKYEFEKAANNARALKHARKADFVLNSGRHRGKLVMQAKTRAKRDGIAFSLKSSDINVPAFCPVLGIELRIGKKCVSGASPTIDRIDPAGGYVPENVLIVSHRANRLKSNAPIAELRRIVEFYEALEHAYCDRN